MSKANHSIELSISEYSAALIDLKMRKIRLDNSRSNMILRFIRLSRPDM